MPCTQHLSVLRLACAHPYTASEHAALAHTSVGPAGLVTTSSESMDWARPAAEPITQEAAPKVSERKDETRVAKRVRRREQQKVAQQRYRRAAQALRPPSL